MTFLIQKRQTEHAEGYPNLFPFKKVIKVAKMPTAWKQKIPEKFGKGEYLITDHCNGRFSKFFYGILKNDMRW